MSKDEEKPKKIGILGQIFGGGESQDDRPLSEAENVSMIIAEWLKKKHIRYKTRYTKRQVPAVSTLQSLADTYKIKTLQRYLDEFRTNKLSEDSKSSEELEAILKSRHPTVEEGGLEKLSKYLE